LAVSIFFWHHLFRVPSHVLMASACNDFPKFPCNEILAEWRLLTLALPLVSKSASPSISQPARPRSSAPASTYALPPRGLSLQSAFGCGATKGLFQGMLMLHRRWPCGSSEFRNPGNRGSHPTPAHPHGQLPCTTTTRVCACVRMCIHTPRTHHRANHLPLPLPPPVGQCQAR
jgi:hypothetical protein